MVENLSFSYGKHPVLRDISFSLESGRMLSILGPNGVGKSTLFQCILGLRVPSFGIVRIAGEDIRQLSVKERAKRVAYIPQSHSPSFNYSVFDMVLMGTAAQVGIGSSPDAALRCQAEQAMKSLNIWYLRDRGFMEISGGEQQLVCIARAMSQGAKVLVMDEPTANLDYGNQMMVQLELSGLTKNGYTILQSTHNPEQAYLFSDYILAMLDGKVEMYGTPQEVVKEELIKKLYRIDVTVESLKDDSVRVCIPEGI